MRRCYDMQGREVDCVLTENWLNAAGIYAEQNLDADGNQTGPTGAYVDLGNVGLTGFWGGLQLPTAQQLTDRMVFIDDPAWKHWLKIILMIIAALMALRFIYQIATL